MLPLSHILQISSSVDAQWRSPVADVVASIWGIPSGSARWLRSSASHVFIVPPSPGHEEATYLRFAPAATSAARKLENGAQLMATWAERGLGSVSPRTSINGRLTETISTPMGEVTAMLVPEAPGAEIEVEALNEAQASAWGSALAGIHANAATGAGGNGKARNYDGGTHLRGWDVLAVFGDSDLADAVRNVADEIASLDPAFHSRGMCHGDFELDNLRFSSDGVTFFDIDEAHFGFFAGDVALAVRDLTGVTPGARGHPGLLAAFLSGYRSRRIFTVEEERSLPLHSLAASARLLVQLEGALDAGAKLDDSAWLRELHATLQRHREWHIQRLLERQGLGISARCCTLQTRQGKN